MSAPALKLAAQATEAFPIVQRAIERGWIKLPLPKPEPVAVLRLPRSPRSTRKLSWTDYTRRRRAKLVDLGLTVEGKVRVRNKYPQLKGLKGNDYARALMRIRRGAKAGIVACLCLLLNGCSLWRIGHKVPDLEPYPGTNAMIITEPPVVRGIVVTNNSITAVASTITEGRSSLVVVPRTVKVRWAWQPSPGAVGYRVYTGPTPKLRPGTHSTVATVTQAAFTNTVPISMGSNRLYVVVRPLGADGHEGEASNEAVWPRPMPTQLVMVLPVAKGSIYAGPNLRNLAAWTKVADVTNGRYTNTTGVAPTMMFAASTNWPTMLAFRWERQ